MAKLFIPAIAAGKEGETNPKTRQVYINQSCIAWVDLTRRIIKTTDGEMWRFPKNQKNNVMTALDIETQSEPFTFNDFFKNFPTCPF